MSLQIWLPLNGSIKNQGLSDLTFTASNLTHTTTDGKLGSCYTGNGSNGTLMSTQNIDLGNHQSMFCWMKATTFATNPVGICTNHHYVRQVNMGLTLVRSSSTQAYLSVSLGKTNGRDWANYKSSTLLNAGTWYHVGYTYDGEKLKLYINGQLDASYNITNIQTGPAPFGCYLWAVNHSSYYLSGHLNDVRVYDHTLSTKEIKEIYKTKIIHYPFDKGDYVTVDNIIGTPIPNGVASYGWDATLHTDAINVRNWTGGYNSGVGTPAQGYHAHWKMMDGIPTMVFPRLNYTIGSANRWLGISESGPNHSDKIKASTTYTISFECMTDTPGRRLHGGLYYYNTAGTRAFHDGSWVVTDMPVGKWKRYSFTFTTISTMDTSKTSYFYFYGHEGSVNGIAYLRNPQVEIGSVAHDYVIGSKTAESVVYDASGYQRNGAVTNTLTLKSYYPASTSTTDSNMDKNFQYTYFNGSAHVCDDTLRALPDKYTLACWINRHGHGHAIDWRNSAGSAGVQPLYFNSEGKIQIFSTAGGTDNSKYFDYVFNTNTWYHIALIATATTLTLYVNGVKQQTKTISHAGGAQVVFHVGCRCSKENITNMSMRDLRVYATDLTDNDIKQLVSIPVSIDNHQNLFTMQIKEGE